MSDFSIRGFYDLEMGTEIKWQMDLVSGFKHVFLPEAPTIQRSSPRTLNNPSIGAALDNATPDIVLCHGYNSPTHLRAIGWARTNRVPLMLIGDSEDRQVRSVAKRAAKHMILRPLFKQFSAFLTTGDENEKYLEARGVPRRKLFRSPYTIDETTYLRARNAREVLRTHLRTELGIRRDEIVFLTVGKLSERKRPRDIVDAARQIVSKWSSTPVRFLVVGNGSELKALKAVSEAERLPITFSGFVNVDELPKYYAAADALIHPAEADPHPLVLSEAACIGLPLIVSDRVGAIGQSDIARNGENCIVTPVGNAAEIARVVQTFSTDPSRRASMSRASKRIYGELDTARSLSGLKSAVEHSIHNPAFSRERDYAC
ncbi:MAG: glycosyltransferase family 4 protein [Pseudomonadota bacterium]